MSSIFVENSLRKMLGRERKERRKYYIAVSIVALFTIFFGIFLPFGTAIIALGLGLASSTALHAGIDLMQPSRREELK